MKITKRKLRRIISEERSKLLKEQSPASRQANLLSAIDQGIGKVEEVEKAFRRPRSRSPKDSKDSDTRESDRRKRSPKARKDSDSRESDRRSRSPRARKDADSPEDGDKARRPSRQRES